MNFLRTEIPEVIIVQPRVFRDQRGYFMETYQVEKFSTGGITHVFVQDNHSHSKKWTLRGLHYQLQHVQGKLVRVVSGVIFDVAVDLRASSATFGKWVGIILSVRNKRQLWVPPGFAHGFLVLSQTADVLYKATDFYDPKSEKTVLWNDPRIKIEWPLPADQFPQLSSKDLQGTSFERAEVFR